MTVERLVSLNAWLCFWAQEDFEDGDGCGGDAGDAFGRGDDAKPSPYSTPIPSIDPLQLILKEIVPRAEEREGAAEASSRPRLVLLDVRPYEAYREGRVPASISMPLAGVSRVRTVWAWPAPRLDGMWPDMAGKPHAQRTFLWLTSNEGSVRPAQDAVENELGPPSSRDMPQVVVVGTGTRGSNIRTVMDAQQMWVRLTRVYGYPEDSVQVLDGGYEAWAKLQKDFMR